MGLGDEIMAMGRAEQVYKETGNPVAICRIGGYPREHEAWLGNPAVDQHSTNKIIDGGGARPYIECFNGRVAKYNLNYKAIAGKIWLTNKEKAFCQLKHDFAVISPDVKLTASQNKNFGRENWEKVIKDFPLPVYQLVQNKEDDVIKGAIKFITPNFRLATAVIAKAKLVMCNEGGTHHMAASMGVPAVVFFGSFVPPYVTGYDFHVNISVDTKHGYCGNFDLCNECSEAKKLISPLYVRNKALELLKKENK